MSKEQKYNCIILKKTPFKEADEIVTVFSRELGKLRFLAKSSKSNKSKLAFALQNLLLVNITLAGGFGRSMPKVISSQIVESFPRLRENLQACALAFYASELVYKFTPDEQENPVLFELLTDFLQFLNTSQLNNLLLNPALAKFKINFLDSIGYSLSCPSSVMPDEKLFFSNLSGGFIKKALSLDSKSIKTLSVRQCIILKPGSFAELGLSEELLDCEELNSLLTGFLEYQLERTIHSEKLL
jgi:DNA repair protein RecO (recombination protein O)